MTERQLNKQINFSFAYVDGSGLTPKGLMQDLPVRDSLFEKKSDAEILVKFSQAYLDLFDGKQDLDFELSGWNGVFKITEFKSVGGEKVYLAINLKQSKVE